MRRLDLAEARLSISRRPGRRTGDPCGTDGCGGWLGVYHTHVEGDFRISYLRCRICHARPADNKLVVPLMYAPRRRRRNSA